MAFGHTTFSNLGRSKIEKYCVPLLAILGILC